MLRSFVLAALIALLLPAATQAVVDGRPVAPGELPFLATDGSCTAALVGPDRLLTAAHCVQGDRPARSAWRLADGTPLRAIAIALHPRWDVTARDAGRPAGHDLALVRIAARPSPTPVALATAVPPAGTPVLTAGWGGTAPAGTREQPEPAPPSPEPHLGELAVLDRDACAAWYRDAAPEPAAVPSPTLCARDADGRTSPCNGDSGGPLLTSEGGLRVVGVFSLMHRCGADGDPAVFADVAAEGAFLADPRPTWAPEPRSRPRIIGDPRPGGRLTCGPVRWANGPTSVRYRWAVAGRMPLTLPSARSPHRVVRRTDGGRRLTCVVLGRNAGGFGVSDLAAPVGIRAR